jgi:hypothetical protein
MSFLRRGVLLVVLVAGLLLVVGGGVAFGGVPWWHVDVVSAPAGASSNESEIIVEVSDIGDGYVNGVSDPVSIVDTLPVGVTPLNVYGEGGGGAIGQKEVQDLIHCSFTGQVVSCSYPDYLLDYERFMIAIPVSVDPGTGTGMNEVSVSGGGAAPVSFHRALALGGVSSYGAENYELTPEEEGGGVDTQAGSHPFQLTSTLAFNTKTASVNTGLLSKPEVLPEVQPVALTKDLRFVLPPGLVGNPTPLPKCSTFSFTRNAVVLCPADTVVGVATSIVTNTVVNAHVPLAETVPLYSLEAADGEPARFGFTTPAGPVVLDTSVETGGEYNVVITVPDIPDDIGFIGAQATFWGVPAIEQHDTARGTCLDQFKTGVVESPCPSGNQGKPQPFLIMPTSCTGPLQSSVEGDSWANIGQFTKPFAYTFQNNLGQPVGEDGCDLLNFEPSLTAAPDGKEASTPTGLTVGVHVAQEADLNPNGLAESAVKDTTVTLPSGIALNPAGADGLMACGLSEIALQSPAEQSCPEAAKVGTLEIHTPLLPHPLVGAAYLAQQDANPFGSLIALYLVARDPVSGVLLKVAGEVTPQEGTGQLISTFKNTPQLPFEDLELKFFGGSRAPLGTPALCGSYTTSATIAPWSGNPASNIDSPPFTITSGPNKSSCSDPLPFKPELTTGSLNLQAGQFTPFTTTMSREDGNQNLNAIQLHLPPGLSGLLTGVTLCSEAQGDAGTCGPGSMIGETTVSVGLGGNPYTVTGGKVYITGPYEGAPFGLSIVNPAKAGPFDLGQVVVRAKIEVDPSTSALTITTDTSGPFRIPQMLDGIPLQIKHVNVTINRQNFTFNPTNCEPLKITGSLSSSQGTISALSIPFQVTNCATLKFKPQFAVSSSGHTSRANGASLHVKLSYPKAPFGTQANIKSVKVDLPKQLPSRLSTLQKACLAATFNQNPAGCPTASKVGEAKATTPLLPVELKGPAYFVSYGGAKFPELVIVLQGYGVTVDLRGETLINEKTSITSSTFHTIPDVPVGTFELSLPQSHDSALAANGNLCKPTTTTHTKKTIHTKTRNGHTKTTTHTTTKTTPTTLVLPTAFTAQNGNTIHQNTPITITNCPKPPHKTTQK